MVQYRVPREELPYDPANRKSIVEYAQKLVGRTLRDSCDVDSFSSKKGNKGKLGQAIEYCYFEYEPNSAQEPDFPEVGLELKTNPVKRKKDKTLSAKERLVLTMIDYCALVHETWESSTVLSKMGDMLLITFLHEPEKDEFDYEFEFVGTPSIPPEDMAVIRDDWETIVAKVKAGLAHEISGGDTNYLEACTKGASAKTVRKQPYSDIMAKQRAFALKSSYMTAFYDKNICLESIMRRRGEESMGLEDLVKARIGEYVGATNIELGDRFGLNPRSKSFNAPLTKAMLGVGQENEIAEFSKAGITVRTIRLEQNGRICEHISFPAFEFADLLAEAEWEDSEFGKVCNSKFLFVVFKKNELGVYELRGCEFWSMPAEMVDAAEATWKETRRVVERGVEFIQGMPYCKDGYPTIENDLPGSDYNRIAHVRPHASQRAYRFADGSAVGNVARDASELPDGRAMTKQSFWLDKGVVEKLLKDRGY